jgi:hypothetical protein
MAGFVWAAEGCNAFHPEAALLTRGMAMVICPMEGRLSRFYESLSQMKTCLRQEDQRKLVSHTYTQV